MGGSAHQVEHGFVEPLPAPRGAIPWGQVHARQFVELIQPASFFKHGEHWLQAPLGLVEPRCFESQDGPLPSPR